MLILMDDYCLRPIEEKDLRLLLEWRNSDRIRMMMLSQHKITWSEHKAWFEKIKGNTPPRNFIFEYRNCPIGYGGYSEYDEQSKTAADGLYIGEADGVPVDAGIVLELMLLHYAFTVLNVKAILGTERAENKRVKGMNKAIGFTIVDEKDGIIYLKFRRDDWMKKRPVLESFLTNSIRIEKEEDYGFMLASMKGKVK